MRYAFFKGCFLPVRLPHIEKISRNVLEELGVRLCDVEGFSCCPEPVGFYSNDKLTGTAIAARNISLAEDEGIDLLTLCNGCTYTLKQVNSALKENDELKTRVNEILADTDHQFKGTIKIKHFATVLVEDLGLERVAKKVVNPIEGLKVAGHTGCHIVSPPQIMRFDDPFDPVVLDRMVEVLGAEPADYEFKTLCCGWTLTNYGDREAAYKLLGAKLGAMRDARSDCIATICPQCFYQFDTGQALAVRKLNLGFKLPVLFYLQLLALSMGYSLEDIGYRRHRMRDPVFELKLNEAMA